MFSGLTLILSRRCIRDGVRTSRLMGPRRCCSCLTWCDDSRRFFLRRKVCAEYSGILRSRWRLLLIRLSRWLCGLRSGRANRTACCCHYGCFNCCCFIRTMLRPACHARRSRRKRCFRLAFVAQTLDVAGAGALAITSGWSSSGNGAHYCVAGAELV